MTNTTPFRLTAIYKAVGALLMGTSGVALAAPTYAPFGAQQNVPFATVTGGGWTPCFVGRYGDTSGTIASMVAGCSGDLLMMAGGRSDSTDIQLLGWASKSEVLQETAANTVHDANGLGWYLNTLSWGFAPEGFAIDQQSADVNSSPGWSDLGDGGNTRLSWHTQSLLAGSPINSGLANTRVNGGFRLGRDTVLNTEPTGFTRYLFTANSSPANAVPEPAGVALVGLGLAAAGWAGRRRRRS